ncbi:MAG TPA: DUF3465 domain-containing protein [Candidatus Baltobacterales bacterium]|nr:DUF3465 domain-containing protein [Candidatus Baltobacterales bacterium]
MRLAALVAAALLLLFACGGRDVPDDQGLHSAIASDASGTEVTFDATVISDPVESGGHERFEVKAPTGETLEIDYNTTLAQSVPLRSGDQVIIHGQLYIDPGPHVGVHCTHAATSSGCPVPGWIEFANNYYE